MFNHKKLIPHKRAIFTLILKHFVSEDYEATDYNNRRHKEQRTYDNLEPDGNFIAKYRNRNEHDEVNRVARYNDVRAFCEKIINNEIANELQELIDLPIKEVKVNRIYNGSLIIVFSVLLNIY